jgi:hypothetical protein
MSGYYFRAHVSGSEYMAGPVDARGRRLWTCKGLGDPPGRARSYRAATGAVGAAKRLAAELGRSVLVFTEEHELVGVVFWTEAGTRSAVSPNGEG